jgi:hypothetical protein
MHWNSSPGSSKPIERRPLWVGDVDLTADLMYRYVMPVRSTKEVLKDDLIDLQGITQVRFFGKMNELSV